jgi:hypothetical protein
MRLLRRGNRSSQLSFNGSLRVDFQGARVTSDADQLTTAVGENRRTADQTRPLLPAPAGPLTSGIQRPGVRVPIALRRSTNHKASDTRSVITAIAVPAITEAGR